MPHAGGSDAGIGTGKLTSGSGYGTCRAKILPQDVNFLGHNMKEVVVGKK
jgi:hypothetical protein